jgi:DNA-binding GntR family transcriptional regulator
VTRIARRELIRTGTTVEQMARTLADDIVMGAFDPGERLDEVSLAARFGVSRTPVREALGQLSAIGLVERRPNRGAIVAVVSHEHLMSMFEAMAELEAICAGLAAARMTPTERSALEKAHLASAELVQNGAEEEYEAHNTQFHTQLYLGAHSKHICELAMLTRSRLAPFRRAQFHFPHRLAKSWQEHDAIVNAIMRADTASAGGAAKSHVSIVAEVSAAFAQDAPNTAPALDALLAARASSD